MLSYLVASGFCESGMLHPEVNILSTRNRVYNSNARIWCEAQVRVWFFLMEKFVEDYLDRKRICDKPKTVELYRHWIKKFHEHVGKGMDEINFKEVVSWSEYLKRE